MLDCKGIITKRDALGMSGAKIAESLKVNKSMAFRECPALPCSIANKRLAAVGYFRILNYYESSH